MMKIILVHEHLKQEMFQTNMAERLSISPAGRKPF